MTIAPETPSTFAHLHVHTEHSPLDGLSKLKSLFERVAAIGQRTCAVTDHGTLSGLWLAQKAADAAGVKLAPGEEFYLAYGSRFEPGSEDVPTDDGDDSDDAGTGRVKTRRYQHLTVIAINPDGWRSLVRLRNESERTKVTVAGKPYPLIDIPLLAANATGIVVLTGCLGGPVLGPLARGDEALTRRNLDDLLAAVGRDRLFVEVMSHGIPAEDAVLPRLAEIADEYALPLVATNDSHYLDAADAAAHDAWLALRTKKTVDDTKRYRFTGSGYHVKTEAEMRAVRPDQWWQDAVTNTALVADRVTDRVLPRSEPMLPTFPVPPEFASPKDYLIKQIRDGAARIFGDPLPEPVRDRLNTELSVILRPSPDKPELSFDSYMLMVAEMIAWEERDGGYAGAGRGSGAGCLIGYCLGITKLDPLEHNLLFERFLEPGRSDWPDIDTDFQKTRRDDILDHLAEFWGADRVVQIGSFAKAKSKRALRDAARVLGMGHTGDVLAKAVPIVDGGKPMPLALVTDDTNPATGEFRRLLERHGVEADRVLTLARSFEDTAAELGIHACGVLVADRDLFNLIPLRRHKDTGRWISEWDSHDIEELGGVKLDVLALRNLDMAADAIALIEEQTGERIDLAEIPDGSDITDPRVQATWRLLQDGRTAGVFQMESAPMAQLARDVRPTHIDDLSAVIALYRPGPLSAGMHTMYAARKNGLEPVDYDWLTSDPDEQRLIASVLQETYGLIVYQEQMMQLSGLVAGFDAKERSKLRKAVGKKLKDQMAEVGQMLLDRAEQEFRDDRGQVISPSVSRATVQRLYDAIKGAAEYSFNKSHSAAYARLAWQTAYLKANWPAAYGAAILGATDDKDKRIEALHSLTAEGIDVLPPDINSSGVQTRPEGSRAVRLGLAEVKGTGEQVAARIIAARTAGAFTSMHDLVFRVRKSDESAEQAVKASDLVALIEAGALDALGPRMGLFMMARTAKTADLPIPDVEWGVIERTSRQRNRLLTVVGENPLATFQATLRAWNVPGPVGPNGEVLHAPGTPVGMLPDQDGASVTTIGILSAFATRTYRGGTMASLTIEGTGASIRGVMWDEALARAREAGSVPPVGSLIGATGRIQVRELETENDDGEVVTRRLREITVGTLHPVPVDDPVRGGLPDDVPVPNLTTSKTRDATLEEQTLKGAPEADTEEKPSGLQIEALFGADAAPPGPPVCATSQPASPPELDSSLQAGSDELLREVDAAPVVHLSAAGWIASDDASAPELRDTVTRLLAGSPVEGARLLWEGGRPVAVVAGSDEVVAHIR